MINGLSAENSEANTTTILNGFVVKLQQDEKPMLRSFTSKSGVDYRLVEAFMQPVAGDTRSFKFCQFKKGKEEKEEKEEEEDTSFTVSGDRKVSL